MQNMDVILIQPWIQLFKFTCAFVVQIAWALETIGPALYMIMSCVQAHVVTFWREINCNELPLTLEMHKLLFRIIIIDCE